MLHIKYTSKQQGSSHTSLTLRPDLTVSPALPATYHFMNLVRGPRAATWFVRSTLMDLLFGRKPPLTHHLYSTAYEIQAGLRYVGVTAH